jgi:succinoglycan biosynthesis protein ExoW
MMKNTGQSDMADRITVIIPYYQKNAGILRKAVASAMTQDVQADVQVIVVDDASPVPASSELADLIAQYPGQIHIITQANAGPAAARNKGLDHVPAGTEYVAFLDSDDEWIATHLSNALMSLNAGCDFYFADHYQLHQTVSAFNRAKRIAVSEHPCIAGAEHLHAYEGDMFDQILRGNIIGTSTVVYRYAKFPKQRFHEEFVYAGEDYLFWLELAQQTKKIAFSALCECKYGEGVNIFSGSGWGTENSLIRIHHEMKFKKALTRFFSLNQAQLAFNAEAVRTLRSSFVADVLHRLSHRRKLDSSLLRRHFHIDPQSFFYFVPLAISLKLKRSN